MLDDFSKHQQGIIKRFYANIDKIQVQKLSELVTELYLASEKKREKLWKTAASAMERVGVPKQRIDHIVGSNKPELLAALVQELSAV
jgi:hypothetical protein